MSDLITPQILDGSIKLNSLTTTVGNNLLRYSQNYDVTGSLIYPYVGAVNQQYLYWNSYQNPLDLGTPQFIVNPSNIPAPDGTSTAQILSGTESFWIDTPISVNLENRTFTHSLFIHNSSTCNRVAFVTYIFNIENQAIRQNWGAYFDTVNGNLVGAFNGDSYKIENYGNGWYRYSYTATASAGNPFPDNTVRCEVYYNQNNNTLANNIVVWGSQLEINPLSAYDSSPYVATTTAAKTEYFSYGVNDGNFILYSEDFTNPVWDSYKGPFSLSATQILTPTATTTAYQLSGSVSVSQNVNLKYNSNPITFSLYVHSSSNAVEIHPTIWFFDNPAFTTPPSYGFSCSVKFNPKNGQYLGSYGNATPLHYSSQYTGDGWYRYSITTAQTSGLLVVDKCECYYQNFYNAPNPTLSGSMITWGWQFEQRPYAGSYIRTYDYPVIPPSYNGFINLPNVEPSLGLPAIHSSTNAISSYYFSIINKATAYNQSRSFTGNDTLVLKNNKLGFNNPNPTYSFDINGNLNSFGAQIKTLSTSYINQYSTSSLSISGFNDVNINSSVTAFNVIANQISSNKVYITSLTSLSTLTINIPLNIIQSITINNNGYGYEAKPNIIFLNGGPNVFQSASAIANLDTRYGSISSITLVNAGLGYTLNPTLSFSTTQTSSLGITSIGVKDISNNYLYTGFTSTPLVSVYKGLERASTSAIAYLGGTSTTLSSTVTSINILNTGYGYSVNLTPSIKLSSNIIQNVSSSNIKFGNVFSVTNATANIIQTSLNSNYNLTDVTTLSLTTNNLSSNNNSITYSLTSNSINVTNLSSNNIKVSNTFNLFNKNLSANHILGKIDIDSNYFGYNINNQLSASFTKDFYFGVKPSDSYSTDDKNLVRTLNGPCDPIMLNSTDVSDKLLKPFFKNINGVINYINQQTLRGNTLNINVYENIIEGELYPGNYLTDKSGTYCLESFNNNMSGAFFSTEWLQHYHPELISAGLSGGNYFWSLSGKGPIYGSSSVWSFSNLNFSVINLQGMHEWGSIITNPPQKQYRYGKPFDQSSPVVSFRTFTCANSSLTFGNFGNSAVKDFTDVIRAPHVGSFWRPLIFQGPSQINIKNLCFEFSSNYQDITCLWFQLNANGTLSNVTIAMKGTGYYFYSPVLSQYASLVYFCGTNQIDPFHLTYQRWSDKWGILPWQNIPTSTGPEYYPGFGLAIVGNDGSNFFQSTPTKCDTALIGYYEASVMRFKDYGVNNRSIGYESNLNTSVILDGKMNGYRLFDMDHYATLEFHNQLLKTQNFKLSTISYTTDTNHRFSFSNQVPNSYAAYNFRPFDLSVSWGNFNEISWICNNLTSWEVLRTNSYTINIPYNSFLVQFISPSDTDGGNLTYNTSLSTLDFTNMIKVFKKYGSQKDFNSVYASSNLVSPNVLTYTSVANLKNYDTQGLYTLTSPVCSTSTSTMVYYTPPTR